MLGASNRWEKEDSYRGDAPHKAVASNVAFSPQCIDHHLLPFTQELALVYVCPPHCFLHSTCRSVARNRGASRHHMPRSSRCEVLCGPMRQHCVMPLHERLQLVIILSLRSLSSQYTLSFWLQCILLSWGVLLHLLFFYVVVCPAAVITDVMRVSDLMFCAPASTAALWTPTGEDNSHEGSTCC